ncbi:unnamed protein product, partial [Rotaria sp. Silwood2]
MLLLGTLFIVVLSSLNSIVCACNRDPYEGVLVVAAGNFLSASSDQGVNWSPAERKGQMTFNSATFPDGSTSTPTPTCSNPYQNRIVRASGDYQTELGSTASWLATEENSLMRFDATSCLYLLTL